MNLRRMDKRSRCVIAWSTVLLFATLVYIAAIEPVLSKNREYNATLERGAERLERLTRLIQSAPGLQTELERMRGSGLSGLFYREGTPALAATEMQKRLNGLVEASRGQVISTQVLRPEKQDHFTKVGIKAQVVTNFTGMQALLRGLADARPALFMSSFQARVRAMPRGPKGEEMEPQFDVSFDVTAYMKESGA